MLCAGAVEATTAGRLSKWHPCRRTVCTVPVSQPGVVCEHGPMGIGSWLKSLGGKRDRAAEVEPAEMTPRIRVTASAHRNEPTGLAYVAGTTTFAKDAVQALADCHRLAERDVLQTRAVLRRYPEFDNAVTVLVDGVKVGALSRGTSQAMIMTLGDERQVDYQLHVLRTEKQLEALAHVWLGPEEPEWEYTRDNPAPLTTAERAVTSQRQITETISARLQDVLDAPEITAGMVKGYHYVELAEPIKQLKRDGRLQDALTLSYAAIEAAENEARHSRREPAPAYTLHAAVVHRKLGQHEEERAVLERWIAATPKDRRADSKVAERLNKLDAKR